MKVKNHALPVIPNGQARKAAAEKTAAIRTLEHMRGSTAWQKAKEYARRNRGVDLEFFLLDNKFEILRDPTTPASVKVKIHETFDNIQSFETKEYAHIAPTNLNVAISQAVPKEFAGLDPAKVALAVEELARRKAQKEVNDSTVGE